MYKDYEDELQLLIDKVEGASDETWEELVNELDVRMHPDSLRKSFNVGRYSGYQVAKYYQEKFTNEYCSDEEIEKLESLKNEIYKEKIKYQDARREYRKHLSAEARYENLADILREEVKKLNDLPTYKLGENVKKNITPKYAIASWSDWHIGAKVDSQWGYYSIDTAQERVNQLVRKIQKYALEQNITDLVIEINGDMIEGGIILAAKIQSEEDSVAQIAIVSEMLANAINELKPYFRNIKVVTTLGNHGRLVPDKKASVNKENMEMLIPEFLRLRISKDIPIITSHGMDFVKYNFDGKTIVLSHGQNDKGAHILEDFVKIYGEVPDEIHTAHVHNYSDKRIGNVCVTVNGSLKGSDEYSINLRENSKPSQNLIVYGEDRCVYELILD